MSATLLIPRQPHVLRRVLSAPGPAIGIAILTVLIAGAIAAPWIAPYDWNETRVCPRLFHPAANHPFGCDLYGRDIFSRVLYGGRYSLSVGLATVAVSLVFGGLLGTVLGYAGGRTDAIGSRAIDVLLGFPPIILAILVVAVLGVSLWTAALAVGIAGIPRFARVIRGATMALREREFIEGAHAIGATRPRVIRTHLLPNLAPTMIVLASLDLGNAVLFTATLSFLGLGAQPPAPEWGAMLNAGREFIRYAPWTMLFPGSALFLAVMAVNLVGDRLSQVLDPRQRGRV